MSLNCKVVCKRSRSHTTTGQSRVRDSLWCASRAGPQARLASIIASRDSAYHCDKVSSVIDTRVRDASAQPYRERFIPHETMHGNAATAHFASRARLPGPSCEQRNIFSPRTFCQVARHFPLLPSLAGRSCLPRALRASPVHSCPRCCPWLLAVGGIGLDEFERARGGEPRRLERAALCFASPLHPPRQTPLSCSSCCSPGPLVRVPCCRSADGGGSDPSLRRLTGRARGVRQDASRP